MRKDDTHRSRSVNVSLYDAHDWEGLGGDKGFRFRASCLDALLCFPASFCDLGRGGAMDAPMAWERLRLRRLPSNGTSRRRAPRRSVVGDSRNEEPRLSPAAAELRLWLRWVLKEMFMHGLGAGRSR